MSSIKCYSLGLLRAHAGSGIDLFEVGKDVARRENSCVVLRVSGECKLLALVMYYDKYEAIKLLSEISKIPGVDKAESHVVLESIKMSGMYLK